MNKKFERKQNECSVCGSHKAIIRKYGLEMCRRCFKQSAKKLGFEKYD